MLIEGLDTESKDLTVKIEKLKSFIDSNSGYDLLSDIHKILLVNQFNAMELYVFALNERIYDLKNRQ